MGEQALKSYMKGQKHTASSKSLTCFGHLNSWYVVQFAVTVVYDDASCSASPGSSLQSSLVLANTPKHLAWNFASTDSQTK